MSSTTFSQTCGTLTVRPISAEIISSQFIYGKMKLFCKVRLGKGVLETMIDKKNGKKPAWSSSLKFAKKNEDSLHVEVHHKGPFLKPKLIGECHIPLDAMVFIAEVCGRCELLQAGKSIGYLDILIKWEPENGAHPSPITRATIEKKFSFSKNSVAESNSKDDESCVITLYQSMNSLNGNQSSPRHISLPHLTGGSNLQTILENFSQAVKKRIEELQKEEESEDPDLSIEKRCAICLERKKAGIFYSCGHNCCCVQCGISFIGGRCPICRELVFDFIKLQQIQASK